MKRHPPAGATARARRLRRDMTDAERAMWNLLREAFPEMHFRRQVPIRQFIADFASHRAKVIIEVDGGQHATERGAPRSKVLEDDGYTVLRFWNHDVLGNREGVYLTIVASLRDRHPHPAVPDLDHPLDGPAAGTPIKGEE